MNKKSSDLLGFSSLAGGRPRTLTQITEEPAMPKEDLRPFKYRKSMDLVQMFCNKVTPEVSIEITPS
jgi:hypothetical protein